MPEPRPFAVVIWTTDGSTSEITRWYSSWSWLLPAAAGAELLDVAPGEELFEVEEPLLQPARTSAASAAAVPTATGRRSGVRGPVGRGPAGIGRVGSFLGCTWLPPVPYARGPALGRALLRSRTGPDFCQHFTSLSESTRRLARRDRPDAGTDVDHPGHPVERTA
ncbi:hypothetical protein GCM10010495_11670 [Kitasatospora herbaricolor]|nr:hypothetical protein GCM10010495_11670 [Kitasatospora herbaricolor]